MYSDMAAAPNKELRWHHGPSSCPIDNASCIEHGLIMHLGTGGPALFSIQALCMLRQAAVATYFART